MKNSAAQFGLVYVDLDHAADYLASHDGNILGVIGFGRRTPIAGVDAQIWVDIPVIGGPETSLEIWTSDAPVTACNHNGLNGAYDGKVLFGSLTLEQGDGETLQTLANQAYTRIFEFIDHHDYRNLLRVWHYFPEINDDEFGMERYRGFNVGRHEAFVANYALFFDHRCISQQDRERTMTSLLFANLSTVFGFGLLSFSQSPVLHAIGFTVALGAVLSLIFSAILNSRIEE